MYLIVKLFINDRSCFLLFSMPFTYQLNHSHRGFLLFLLLGLGNNVLLKRKCLHKMEALNSLCTYMNATHHLIGSLLKSVTKLEACPQDPIYIIISVYSKRLYKRLNVCPVISLYSLHVEH